VLTRIPWSLKEHPKFGIFCTNLFHQVKMAASMLPVLVGALPRFRCCAL
jgi:hypothetical protein